MSNSRSSRISLIGMPGSGKSTVGVLLAKRIGLAFVDTDILIQEQEQATLAEIIARSSAFVLREIEEQVLLDMPITDSVISTGGSVVYSPAIMERLSARGIETRPFFPAVHLMPPYVNCKMFTNVRNGVEEHTTVSERMAAHGLCLPTYVGLTDEDCTTIGREFLEVVEELVADL